MYLNENTVVHKPHSHNRGVFIEHRTIAFFHSLAANTLPRPHVSIAAKYTKNARRPGVVVGYMRLGGLCVLLFQAFSDHCNDTYKCVPTEAGKNMMVML